MSEVAMPARIDLDPDRTLGEVDRRIFGGFIEHVGRCIYGGITDHGSSLSDERGIRLDVLEAARRLRMPMLRWPGGNFVSNYHWQDGVGPVAERPRRLELAWHHEEPNTFGTDEYVEYCRRLGTEPYICLNLGSGSLDEALAWVEYCNGTGDTEHARARRRNGHPEPHNVKYWGLGNELYGRWQVGQMEPDEYVRKARRFARALRRVDPSIQLVSCGHDGISEWDRIVIEGLVADVDFHTFHIYTGSADYWTNVLQPHRLELALDTAAALVERARHLQGVTRPVGIALDEWNVWYRSRDERSGLEERYTLSDALAVGTFMNIFVRHCRTLRIANLAQLVNVIAPIVTSPVGMYLQPTYHPLVLCAENVREIALDCLVQAPAIPADAEGRSVLDVAASRDVDGAGITVTVVNRGDHAVDACVRVGSSSLAGAAVSVQEVTGDGIDVGNSFEQPDRVSVRAGEWQPSRDAITVRLKPHSFTCVTADLAGTAGNAEVPSGSAADR